ncbi:MULTISPECIES: hypothetical protein [Kitasatospora]|uniref:ATP/GTP-binding protein n=1 Tax=Kitasatospora setae (strain ATCC 33774 / DSM 43861 / JCM 3304 / KCC A-0304 / NBRC 14216 / KM-6054) TaxID=452652 RepID=E4N1Z6_KITSK|nr:MULTISPECIES: hypothetical protein [Kitasatospora]BAJ32180.1 hypothetical protein KSE_64210 [Kitasatospora setae KM-6054]
MLNSAWRTAICVLIGLGLAATAVPAASADDGGGVVIGPCADLSICTGTHHPGSTPTAGGGGTSGGSGGGTEMCTWKDKQVPCWRDDLGWFSEGCYYSLVTPQPLAGDRSWEGHTSKDGAIYQKACDLTGDLLNFQSAGQTFLAQAPGKTPPKTPAQLAYDALQEITVVPPVLHAAPGKDAVVGSPVWLWMDANPRTVGPLSSELQGEGFKVTTTITLAEVEWSVDDGPAGDEQVGHFSCKDGGNPFSSTGTPSCSHVFEKSSAGMKEKAFTLGVRMLWHVSAHKDDGTPINMIPYDWWPTYTDAVLQVPVNEVQVLN